jgi:ADP-heptose:LPS heptosyltransferase
MTTTGRSLVTRLDSLGDVLLAGPAVRALGALGPVDVLCSHIGAPGARVLPGVDEVLTFDAPWVLRDAPDVERDSIESLVATLTARSYTRAAVLTSAHQSALPMALLLRLAGVGEIAAVSLDHAGRLLDHRITGDPDVHEVERALLVTDALGARRPDPPSLAVRVGADVAVHTDRLVIHPGSAAPARTLRPAVWREVAAAAAGRLDVVVTGGRGEGALCADVAGSTPGVRVELTDTLADLADVLASAAVVACGNTGPMHLAAALGRPLVVPFAATVPAERWHPWGVPHVLLGAPDVDCRLCRHVVCPLDDQLCLSGVDADAVLRAVDGFVRPTMEVVS